MNNSMIKFFQLIIVLFILTSVCIPTIFVKPNFSNSNESDDSFKNNHHDEEFPDAEISSPKAESNPSHTITRSTQEFDDRTYSRQDIITFKENRIYKNLTIRDNATINVDGYDLEIRGKLNIMDNGQLIIKNSNLTIAPGPVDIDEIIISFSENAVIRIENSNFYTYPQPTSTNISYLLSDDFASVTIIDSYVNIKIPAVLFMDVALSPATAGVFILTGETEWNIHNSEIEGYLMIKNDELLSRWFLITLQRKASLFLKNCIGILNDESQPFIKPVAGFLKIEDSKVLHGIIELEVIAEFEAVNLTIMDIGINDQSKAQLIQTTILDSIDIGGFATIPTGAGDTAEIDVGVEGESKAFLTLFESTIGNTLIARGSSTTTTNNCTIYRCSISSEATVNLGNNEITTLIDVKENATVNIDKTSIHFINIGDNCNLNIYQSTEMPDIRKITSGFNSHAKITMYSTKLWELEIFGGDKISPEDYGPWYDPDLNTSKITLNMFDSSLDQLKSDDDAQILITLQNSEINEFKIKKFKNEPVRISISDHGSNNYMIPDPWPDTDLEFLIYHQITIETQVNDEYVNAYISVISSEGEQVISAQTQKKGIIDFELLNKKYTSSSPTMVGTYSIDVSFLGFYKNIKSTAELNEVHNLNWQDNAPPVVDDINIDTSYQHTNRGTRIRAVIKDDGVKAIANASLYYQYYTEEKGWSSWQSSAMIEVENNTFEDEIKQLPQGAEVRFYIIAYDFLGNRGVSEKYSYSIPKTDELFMTMVVTLLIIVIVLVLVFFMNRRRKIRKYMKNPPKTEARIGEVDEKKEK